MQNNFDDLKDRCRSLNSNTFCFGVVFVISITEKKKKKKRERNRRWPKFGIMILCYIGKLRSRKKHSRKKELPYNIIYADNLRIYNTYCDQSPKMTKFVEIKKVS